METTAMLKEDQGDFASSSNQQEEIEQKSKSNISVYTFSTSVRDTQVFYQISKFGTTLFIWIGGTDGSLKDLVFASATPYDKGKAPTATKLLGSVGETLSNSLAVKLTQKLKKPVYVSYNSNIVNEVTGLQDVIGRLMEEIKVYPDNF